MVIHVAAQTVERRILKNAKIKAVFKKTRWVAGAMPCRRRGNPIHRIRLVL